MSISSALIVAFLAAEIVPPGVGDEAELQEALQADLAQAASAPVAPSQTPRVWQNFLPDISLSADVALAYFSSPERLEGGDHDPARTGFNLQQLELSMSKVVDPYFRLDSHLVLGEGGVELEEVYATTLGLPLSLQARVGLFLTRFGRLNPTHPHAWDFVDQPLAFGRVFGGEGNRGLGAELSWLVPLPWFVELVVASTHAGGEGTARSFLGGTDRPIRSFLDFQHTLALKQFFELSTDWSLLVGASFATGPNATGSRNRTDVGGVDVYLKYKPVLSERGTVVALQSEWLYRRRQVPGDALEDVSGYASVTWKFARRLGIGARYELGSPTLDRARQIVSDDLDPDWLGARHRASLAATFWPSEFSRIRLQGSADVPAWVAKPSWAAFLAFQFVIGAHGAHSF